MIIQSVEASELALPSKLHLLDVACALPPEDSGFFKALSERRSTWKAELESMRESSSCTDPRLKSWDELRQLRDREAKNVIFSAHAPHKPHMDALVFAIYASINVPRLDLGNTLISEGGAIPGKNCVWEEEEGDCWKLQIAEWNKVNKRAMVFRCRAWMRWPVSSLTNP